MSEQAGFQGVDRVVGIIDVVRTEAPASLAQIARATGLSEPTALRYLNALRRHRIVRRDEVSGVYTLGMRLFEWGEAAHGAYDPKQIAAPFLDRIADEFGETVELAGLEDGDRVLVLDARPGSHGINKVARIGDVEEWHATSVGKSLLAAMQPSRARDIMRGLKLRGFTSTTRTTVADLERDIDAIRERGFAIDNEESERGLRCVGVAIRDRFGSPMFAISVSGPTYRMTEEAVPVIAASLRDVQARLEDSWGLAVEATAEKETTDALRD